jgi:hypothetical protein
MDDCIKKKWHIYAVEYYSTTKKNEITSFAEKWMELEIILLIETGQISKSNTIVKYIWKV